jgi:hypothetical protein
MSFYVADGYVNLQHATTTPYVQLQLLLRRAVRARCPRVQGAGPAGREQGALPRVTMKAEIHF